MVDLVSDMAARIDDLDVDDVFALRNARPARRIELLVDETELARRRAALPASERLAGPNVAMRNCSVIVTNTDDGCGFDFMMRPNG